MKKLALIFALTFGIMPVLAYNLDLSVDSEIQKKYDANKLNKDMQVATPNKIKNSETKQSSAVPKSSLNFNDDTPIITKDNYNYQKNGTFIPKRTHFKVKSNQKISNWNGINSSVSFTTTSPVYKKAVSIPVGTVFKGHISKIHQPQITGNGALVEIKITSLTLNGKSVPVDGKITKANSEFVFFNKIKGDRQYISGVEKKINSATNFYAKSRKTSNKLSQNPVGTILSPIPTIVGFVGATAATIVSPLTGLIEKGKSISFPAGTSFEIKLLENAYL